MVFRLRSEPFCEKIAGNTMKLGHASCRVVLFARNCCLTTLLSCFVVDALLGHACVIARAIARSNLVHNRLRTERPCPSRVAPVEEQNFLLGQSFTIPKNGYVSPPELGWRVNVVLACWLYEACVFLFMFLFCLPLICQYIPIPLPSCAVQVGFSSSPLEDHTCH